MGFVERDDFVIEFVDMSGDIDRWQRFFELCMSYAEVARIREAEAQNEDPSITGTSVGQNLSEDRLVA